MWGKSTWALKTHNENERKYEARKQRVNRVDLQKCRNLQKIDFDTAENEPSKFWVTPPAVN